MGAGLTQGVDILAVSASWSRVRAVGPLVSFRSRLGNNGGVNIFFAALPLAAALTLLGLLAPLAPAEARMDASLSPLAPGMPITPTSLTGLDGKPYAIPSEGPELLLFWSIYDTKPLPAMFDTLRTLAETYPGRVRIRAVNLDSKALVRDLPQRVKERVAAEKATVPTILDPLRLSRDAFHLKRTPALVILKDARIEGFYSFAQAEEASDVVKTLRRLVPAGPGR
ncbi:hypothetical protein D3C87_651250 [compost metagenome]